ncbi:SAM-dependent methyltransferase [Candidatus Bathyarchaeota archaeon]|nr:SAM-dependent methyltransferase [Candidatus Bathyarchaeota archaeon]
MESENTRIETKSSLTAGFMCLSRAASYKDKRECYLGPDNVAYIILPTFFKLLLKSRLLFKLFNWLYFSKGLYEYVIARTKYFDAVFIEALEHKFDQILIFGAGYDSRALRFSELNKGTSIFELDAPVTQKEKLKAYQSKKLVIPKNLISIPIDFNKEKLEDKIRQAGFIAGKQSLFLLEGVTMYLSQDAIDSTFRFISDVSGTGSMIVFDYIYGGVLRRENKYYGEKGMYKRVAKVGEAWTFALEENEAESFLSKYGFLLKDHSGSNELEDRYFRNSKGQIVGKVNGTHAIVTAIKR